MKPKTWTHPKFVKLQRRLGISPATACGILEGIWHLTATFDPAGGSVPYAPEDLCAWLGDDVTPDDLVAALIDGRWLDRNQDGSLSVHDWGHHKPKYIQEAERKRAYRAKLSQDSPKTVPARSRDNPCAAPLSDSVSDSVSEYTNTSAIAEVSAAHAGQAPPNAHSEYGFPTTQGGTWYLPAKKLGEYLDTYDGTVDVDAELKKARQWLRDNKGRRKTVRGMAAFLTRWLNQAQDRSGGGNGRGQSWAEHLDGIGEVEQ